MTNRISKVVWSIVVASFVIGGCSRASDSGRTESMDGSDSGSNETQDASSSDAGTSLDLCPDEAPREDCRSLAIDECVAAGCVLVDDGVVEYDDQRDCLIDRPFQRCDAPCTGVIQTDEVCRHPDHGGCFLMGQMCDLHPELVQMTNDQEKQKCRSNIERAPTCE